MNIPRHKVFISYYHKDDQLYKNKLINMQYYDTENACYKSIFEDCSVRENDIDDVGLSSEQIRRIIRDDYIKDATVLIVLFGANTKKRKHIDWEIHAAMYDNEVNRQMGIIVINLPYIRQHISATNNDERQLLADNAYWSHITERTKLEEAFRYMPSRILDNMEKDVPITVVNWDRIADDKMRLMKLIDNAFSRRLSCEYDHSAPLRRQNS